jgi:uncharacterized protein
VLMESDLKALAEHYDIIMIYLFGSRSDEGSGYLERRMVPAGDGSDLDIAVAFQQPPSKPMDTYGSLYRSLSRIFEPFHVDLVFMHEIDTLFQYDIITGVRIYSKDENSADIFEEGIMRRAGDLLFKKRRMNEEVMEAIADGYFAFEYRPGP